MRALTLIVLVGVMLLGAGCTSLDNKRIPPMAVRLQFKTVGDWNTYGIAGATSTRSFVKSLQIPAGYPYTALSATGYGGLLIAGQFTYSGDPLATPPMVYDLACPVEVKPSVRIEVDRDKNIAVCPQCGSTYDIFNFGQPLSGPALDNRYTLKRYKVTAGGNSGDYLTITY